MTQSLPHRGDVLQWRGFVDGIRGFEVLLQGEGFFLIAIDCTNRVRDPSSSDRCHKAINVHPGAEICPMNPQFLKKKLNHIVNLALVEDPMSYVLESFGLVIKLKNLERRTGDIVVLMVHERYDSRDKHTELFPGYGVRYQCQSFFRRLAREPRQLFHRQSAKRLPIAI